MKRGSPPSAGTTYVPHTVSYVRDVETLADGATVAWTVTRPDSVAKLTLGGNRALAISGAIAGDVGILIVKSGGNQLTLPAGSKVRDAGAGAITLAGDCVLGWVYDGTNYWWNYTTNHT